MSDDTQESTPAQAPTMVADVIYLISCSLNGIIPSADRIDRMAALGQLDDSMLGFCRAHQVCALCAFALKSAGKLDATWEHELSFDEYKHVLQDAERDAVFNALEERHIRHLPLKGTILSGLYPNPLMREMCDSDVLFDSAKVREVDGLMRELGFTFDSDSSSHRSYLKPPFLNFEMHYRLFVEEVHPKLARYFSDAWRMAVPEKGKGYRYRFTPTDFYIYMTLHAYKHYDGAGFGLRTLADEYVMLQGLDGIDFNRVDEVMDELGTQRFEATLRGLASRLFDKALLENDGRPLSDAIAGGACAFEPTELRMLDHVVASGSYGTVAQAAQRRIGKSLGAGMDETVRTSPLDDARYILRRAFPSVRELRLGYPVLRHPAGMVLLPGVYAFRLVRGMTTRRDKTAIELQELKKATG